MTRTPHDERVEKIARRVYEFRWKTEADWESENPEWREYWIESFAYGLAADPYTAEVDRLTGLLAEAKEQLRRSYNGMCACLDHLDHPKAAELLRKEADRNHALLSRIGSGRGRAHEAFSRTTDPKPEDYP